MKAGALLAMGLFRDTAWQLAGVGSCQPHPTSSWLGRIYMSVLHACSPGCSGLPLLHSAVMQL